MVTEILCSPNGKTKHINLKYKNDNSTHYNYNHSIACDNRTGERDKQVE